MTLPDREVLSAATSNSRVGGASFGLRMRCMRMVFMICWGLFASWTPPQARAWRRVILRAFGARIASTANVYSSAKIWYPPNLSMGAFATLGPRVQCYNQALIEIGAYAIVSQDASLCAGTHDYNDPNFQLVIRPIHIGEHAWVAAEAFVGPGVNIGAGAVLGARAVAMKNLDSWTIFSGNPAAPLKQRAANAFACSKLGQL